MISYLKKALVKIVIMVMGIVFINIYFLLLCASRLFIEDLIYLDVILLVGIVMIIWLDYRRFIKLQRLLKKESYIDYHRLQSLCDHQIIKIVQKNESYYHKQIELLNQQMEDLADYISKWSHEAKLPLASLRLINERNQDLDVKKDILESVERLTQLLNTMLMSSKLRNPEYDIKIERVSLLLAIKEALKHQSYFLITNNFQINLPKENHYVYSDLRWLVYMLDQFVANSIKYCHQRPSLSFNIVVADEIILEIIDNGIGILPGDMPYIFDRGFVGSNLRNGDYRSTGMGLYFVKEIARKLGIEIVVDQDYHDGAKFNLIFKDNRDYFFLD